MGKLHLDQDDIKRLGGVFADQLRIEDGALTFTLKDTEFALSELNTSGHVEQKGIRFQINARYQRGELNVDFE